MSSSKSSYYRVEIGNENEQQKLKLSSLNKISHNELNKLVKEEEHLIIIYTGHQGSLFSYSFLDDSTE